MWRHAGVAVGQIKVLYFINRNRTLCPCAPAVRPQQWCLHENPQMNLENKPSKPGDAAAWNTLRTMKALNLFLARIHLPWLCHTSPGGGRAWRWVLRLDTRRCITRTNYASDIFVCVRACAQVNMHACFRSLCQCASGDGRCGRG